MKTKQKTILPSFSTISRIMPFVKAVSFKLRQSLENLLKILPEWRIEAAALPYHRQKKFAFILFCVIINRTVFY